MDHNIIFYIGKFILIEEAKQIFPEKDFSGGDRYHDEEESYGIVLSPFRYISRIDDEFFYHFNHILPVEYFKDGKYVDPGIDLYSKVK